MGTGFYRSNDPTNSVKALKEDRSKGSGFNPIRSTPPCSHWYNNYAVWNIKTQIHTYPRWTANRLSCPVWHRNGIGFHFRYNKNRKKTPYSKNMIIHNHVFLVLHFSLIFWVFFTNLSVCLFIIIIICTEVFQFVSSTWVARISGALGSLGTTLHT